ncbi:MAG: Calx-beta domain-containing protein [Actinomycetota bacterium]
MAVALFGLGVDLVRSGGPPAGASRVIGNPFGGPGERCGALIELALPGGRWTCTHGPDPHPNGADLRSGKARTGLLLPDPPSAQRTAPAGHPYARCFGDGRSGPRFQAIYARASDRVDNYAASVPTIRLGAAEADAVFMASAAASGAIRHIRWQHDANCQPTVDHVILSPSGDDDLAQTIAELTALGYTDPNRKYVVWMDAEALCGISSYYEDDRPGADNFNNGNPVAPPTVSRIDRGCWALGSQGTSIEAHEIMHALGAVMPTAPHSTILGHCTDDADRMCYEDDLTIRVNTVCASNEEAVFDCRKDDYFNAAGNPVGYLASHWNTARSAFLSTTDGDDPLSIVGSTITEGDGAPRPLTFTVSLAVPQNNPASVRWTTVDGSAKAGQDYQAASGTVEFAPLETVKTISVNVTGDFNKEADEDFFVQLSDANNARIVGQPGRGLITNDDPKGQGYWLVASDGGIFSYADAGFFGSTGNVNLNQPIVGMAPTPSGRGYWLVARDGGIFSFGDAAFHGSTGNIRLNQPIVGMAATPSGSGYWLVAADGGVFAFDAPSFGSAAGRSRSAAVAMASTTSGQGYWVVTADGQIFNFGDAPNFGALGPLAQPIVGAAATPSGHGLWLVARDGGIFAFGDAAFFGSTGAVKLNQPIVGMARTPSGNGYWLVAQDGGIFAFGDAGFFGSTGNIRLNKPINGMGALLRPLA